MGLFRRRRRAHWRQVRRRTPAPIRAPQMAALRRSLARMLGVSVTSLTSSQVECFSYGLELGRRVEMQGIGKVLKGA
ncbi:MAG TPA: hypothetical protein VF746_13255 [Longimicrobium sp.]|jgi:hypothetical protein